MSVEQLGKVMALQAEGWLSAGEFKLLLFLADRADAAGGRIFPGDARLLRQTRWTPRYLRLVKRKLTARRWLTIVRPAAGQRRVIYRLTLPTPTADAQLPLPFNPVEKLLKSCAPAADENRAQRISRSSGEDLSIRVTGDQTPASVSVEATSPAAIRADPSNGIRPVLPRTDAERRALARPSPHRWGSSDNGFTAVGDLAARWPGLRRPRMVRASLWHTRQRRAR